MRLLVSNLTHRYDDLTVLDGIDLALAEGEILAVIGPSGCGKSTLLGIAGGIVAPTSGTVRVEGDLPAGCLNPITFIFQDFALLPWRSVEDNVALVLEHHPLSSAERRERIDSGLRRMGLWEFRKALPKQLSGGMRQRVGIARALAVRPAMLLLDEPLSALDAQTRELLMDDFLELWRREKTTALYVTHNLDEALRLADRVCVLSRRPGRVRELVAIEEPRDRRQEPSAQAHLAQVRERLWHLMKAEAQMADREIARA
ncbi:nitrate ABC transporter ATP-binding protein [Azospirillum thiophilum]|uniref:Nitrate ABC transporter ATP-binding protein n=1 Tax=Azospirillum thiophilum TaxID=528244 RepID=A0AAC8VUJ9_9PROT|nr:ABC transporter ATP-binding protein [Azospirillum thiophilum]ALG69838.1 nitrate ABC transporter ATP-binding protein [Azospirillum thiophilum]KJR66478.1 nitrate ABC transporter ATP-binding protein [Azospirillum thiophilum]